MDRWVAGARELRPPIPYCRLPQQPATTGAFLPEYLLPRVRTPIPSTSCLGRVQFQATSPFSDPTDVEMALCPPCRSLSVTYLPIQGVSQERLPFVRELPERYSPLLLCRVPPPITGPFRQEQPSPPLHLRRILSPSISDLVLYLVM